MKVWTRGAAIRLAIAAVILLVVAVETGRSANGLPVCQIKDPPFAPQIVPESDIVLGVISNRCQEKGLVNVPGFDHQTEGWVAARVWQLGAYGCLQARPNFNVPWRNVWCEASQKYNRASLNLFVTHDGQRIKGWADKRKWWEWRIQGHAWVYYVAGGPALAHRSLTVTSPFVPLPVRP